MCWLLSEPSLIVNTHRQTETWVLDPTRPFSWVVSGGVNWLFITSVKLITFRRQLMDNANKQQNEERFNSVHHVSIQSFLQFCIVITVSQPVTTHEIAFLSWQHLCKMPPGYDATVPCVGWRYSNKWTVKRKLRIPIRSRQANPSSGMWIVLWHGMLEAWTVRWSPEHT